MWQPATLDIVKTVKTTVYLDDADYRQLKGVAAAEGCSTAELIRVAVAEFVVKRTQRRLPRSLGAARSGDPTLSERFDDLLEGFGES
jgi:16S rRNA U516 pseudouridylate synthase RsuA-like enzyme